jgi:hypothetical protein
LLRKLVVAVWIGLIIFAVLTVGFLGLVARFGVDSRDGRDWHGDPYAA